MYNKRPKIAVNCDYLQKSEYSDFPHYILRENYLESIYKSGGEPVLLNYFSDISNVTGEYDGILVPGGNFDIPPESYGEKVKSFHVVLNKTRSNFEHKLLKNVINSNMPVLGICGGHQLINVMLGGTLIQHIPDEIANALEHEQKIPKNIPSHIVKVTPNTMLFNITQKGGFMVNSTHHQAVKKLGNNLIVSAVATDGVIEAVESTTHPFLLGVEWHPEYFTTDEDKQIFNHFIEAANKYATTR